MSLASRIVGIPDLEVERVHRRHGIEIWAKPFHRPYCLYCGADKLRVKATYTRTTNPATPRREGSCANVQFHTN